MTLRDRARALFAAPRPATGAIDVGENEGGYAAAAFATPTITSKLTPAVREWASAVELTPDVIRQMRKHFQVSACLTVQGLPLTRSDWTIECEDDDVREYVTRAYSLIAAHLHKSLTKALPWGYSPNTLTWDYDPGTGMLCAVGMRDLDPGTCRPLIEPDGTYAGLVQNLGTRSETLIDDPRLTLWIVEGMESGNLYGRSILEPAREPWVDWQMQRLFHARYLERFGEPVVVGRAPAGMQVANQAEINAAIAAGETPPPQRFEANLDVIQDVADNLRHHSTIALPSDLQFDPSTGKAIGPSWSLDYLEPARSGGADFREALLLCERGIARGIFVPDLLLSNTEAGSYSLGEQHKDVWTLGTEGRLDEFARQISMHYLDDLVTLNFGASAPRARLSFSPLGDESVDNLWELALELAKGGLMPVEVVQLAERLGVPLAAGLDDADESAAAKAAASPFSSVGLPALVSAQIISRDEARELLGVAGEAPPFDPALAAGGGGGFAADRDRIRAELGLHPHGGRVELAAGDPPMRKANDREKGVDWREVERELDAAQAEAVDALGAAVGAAAARVLRQVAGILRRGGTPAEVVAALGTLDVGPLAPAAAAAWTALMGRVWALGLSTVATEVPDYADAVPEQPGRDGKALIRVMAEASAARYVTELSTRVQLEAVNAARSGVSAQGVTARVTDLFDREVRGETQPPTRTAQHLLAKALNEGRADAIQRGGIPLAGAQFSAILDRVTCDLCRELDETTISIAHTDYARFTPPLHHGCRCVWVFVVAGETDFAPTWETPSPALVEANGGLVIG